MFSSLYPLLAADRDGGLSYYESFDDRLFYFSSAQGSWPAVTPDGRHIFVSTNQPLSGDNDGSTRCPFSPGGVENPCLDIFAFRVTPATGYPRPAGAALFRVPLVPAFA